jgi:hypothetical protein
MMGTGTLEAAILAASKQKSDQSLKSNAPGAPPAWRLLTISIDPSKAAKLAALPGF